MFNDLFSFKLEKPLTTGNYILEVTSFSFNDITNEDGSHKYNFQIEGKTSDGRTWKDTIFPNKVGTTNTFELFLRSIQRQLAPDEDWTPPKTKVAFQTWLAMITNKMEGSKLAVSVTQYSTKTKSGFNKNYYQTNIKDETPTF